MSAEQQIVGTHPWPFSAVLWGAPLTYLGVIAVSALTLLGSEESSSRDLIDLSVVALPALLIAIPLVLNLRKIVITWDAITGHRYVGRRKEFLWDEIQKAELFEVTTRRGSKKNFRLTSKEGKRMLFQSHMSNFDELVTAVERIGGVAVIRHPSRPAVGPWEI